MDNTKFLSVSLITATLLFTGCGSSSNDDSTTSQSPVVRTGTFADAPVEGLNYRTATQNGFTDTQGHFQYKDGETVEFKLGTLSLGKGKAGAFVTPYTISDNNTTATNIAMVLQNFDSNRSNTQILDLSKLKDFNFTADDINITAAPSALQNKLTTLLATGSFQKHIDNKNHDLIIKNDVKKNMDDYIHNYETKHSKVTTPPSTDEIITNKEDNQSSEVIKQSDDIKFTSDIYAPGNEYYVVLEDSSEIHYLIFHSDGMAIEKDENDAKNTSDKFTISKDEKILTWHVTDDDEAKAKGMLPYNTSMKIVGKTNEYLKIEANSKPYGIENIYLFKNLDKAQNYKYSLSAKKNKNTITKPYDKKFTEDYLKNTIFYEVNTGNNDPVNTQDVGYTWILANHFSGGQWYQNESGINTSDHLPTGGDGDVAGSGYSITSNGYLSVTDSDGDFVVKIIEVTENYIKVANATNPQDTMIWYTNLETVKNILSAANQ